MSGTTRASTLLIATHGGLASKETVLPFCWEARRRGADCVVVDALGHGASGPVPRRGAADAMADALRVDRSLGPYANVRFVGHSMGAYNGCGHAFPCASSISIGQGVECPESRIVWGDLHRRLGLPDSFYMVMSHVPEPWTPHVVRRAVDVLLGPAPHATHVGWTIAVAWVSFWLMTSLGLVGARALRGSSALPPLARGLSATAVVWLAMAIGAWRLLWYLVPTRGSDAIVVALTAGGAAALAKIGSALGVRGAGAGTTFGIAAGASAAIAAFSWSSVWDFAGLAILIPAMTLPLSMVIAVWERATRQSESDAVEAAAFTGATLGVFIALLLPSFAS